MKKIILLILILPIFIFAQNEECAFVPHPEMYNVNNYSRTVNTNFDSDDLHVLNVQFHLVQNDGDSNIDENPFGVNENHLLEIIASINIEFNQFNIFFKYRGYTIIDETDYLLVYGEYSDPPSPTAWDLRFFSITEGNYDYNNINVFITQTGDAAFFGTSDVLLNQFTAKNASNGNNNVSHEFGHALSLLHIFDGTLLSNQFIYDNLPTCGDSELNFLAVPRFNPIPDHPSTYPTNPENVTRDPNDPDFNADIAGDFVIDTSAAFMRYKQSACVTSSNNIETYHFIEDYRVVDQVGVPYTDLEDEINNYMDYARRGSRPKHFSNGQGTRMREAIDLDVFGVLQQKLNLTPDGSPDISVLYEPYKVEEIETISDNIYSLTDNGDGTAEVCRTRSFEMKHYFQPGFDYDFYYGYGTILDHHVDKNELYGILDSGYYRALKIHQISENDIIIHENTVCDRRNRVICATETYSKGTVLSSANLANPNPTIKTLNNQEASDPNLEQNLENNKFHIIEKTTTSGAKIQKTIYKDGN